MYPNSGDWYDRILVILSLRYVVNERMFVEVDRGHSVGSVPIVLTASSYEIGGTDLLGMGDGTRGGTTPVIGSSPSDAVMLSRRFLRIAWSPAATLGALVLLGVQS